jgi:hypothetical protein
MSDVLKSAVKYRARLKAELTKVEDFLRMAEEFSKVDTDGADLPFSGASAAPAEKPAEKPAPAVATAAASEQPTIELARRSGNGAAAS